MQEVTAIEAARLTGRSDRTIRRWIAKGTLPARQIAPNRYAIKVSDLTKVTGHDSPDAALLGRVTQLEEAYREQQARIQELEQRIEGLQSNLDTTTGQRPDTTPRSGHEADKRPVIMHQEATGLPSGSILAAHFAKANGIVPRTLNDWIRAGKVSATTVDKGGRPEHWLTPEQQTAILAQQPKGDRTIVLVGPDTGELDIFEQDMQVYGNIDATVRPFKAWLQQRYPASTIPHQKRRVVDPLHELAARLEKDDRIPEQATKNDYLQLLHNSGYSRDDLRYMHNLWIDFLEQIKKESN